MQTDLPIIRTKTIIPRRRSEILSRPRLLTILDNVLDLKLLILAAPAGYGKTSLLVDFSHHTQVPVCWYALDPLDTDPKRFLSHFIASIHSKFSSFGESSLAALAELSQDKLDLEPVISAIVNDAYEHITEHFIFVLDDYHLVRDSKPIEVFMNRLIQDVAENFHFIIASRTLLTLPDLSLLVARSQVDGLSFEELAFLPEEIKQLMAVNYHLTISDEAAEEMISNTEGWITGLLLTAQLSSKGVRERSRIEKVSGVGIYEYLTQQVFDRQSKSMQSFLLRTSLLEEFDAALCEKIIGKALGLYGQNWNEVIDRIQRDNLFVLPVGDETIFLRYHHLFRDFLQNRMRLERPDEARKIEVELAAYYESIQEWERAIAIYFRIGTEAQVVDLIRKAARHMILSGRLVTLSDWLNSLPNGLADTKPELLSIRGSIAMLRGDFASSLEFLDRAIDQLRDTGADEELAAALIRRSAIKRHLGNYEAALKDALDAIELSKPPFGAAVQFAEALRAEGLVYYQTGELTDALWKLRESYRRFLDLNLESDAAKVLMELGIVYLAKGDLEQTEHCYQDSLEYWERTHNSLWQANVLNNIGVLHLTRGEYEQAVIALEKALGYSRLAVNPRLEGYTLTTLGDVFRDLRALKEARQAYTQASEILKKTNDVSLDVYLTLGMAVLDRIAGYYKSSCDQIARAFEKASQSGSKYEYNSCRLEQAILQFKVGGGEDLRSRFQELEEYFYDAGFHVEGFKASVFKTLLDIESSPHTAQTHLSSNLIAEKGQDGKYPSLIQIGLEFQDRIERLIGKPHVPAEFENLLAEVRAFEKKIPQIHHVVRHYSSAVDFSSPKITIRAFGKMQVRLGNKMIAIKDWKTQVVRDLFFYLLLHPEGVTKEEIGEVFWPDADRDTLRLRFKNTIYRMRRAVGKDIVTYTDDYYRFNRSIDYDLDIDVFNIELEKARNATDTDSQIEHLKAALNVYRGPLLPKLDLDWAIIVREKYQRIYINAAETLINLYIKTGKYTQAVALSNRALEEDIYNEGLHRYAMMAYSALNDRPAIARQFEKCRSVLMNELQIEPSPQTVNLYNSLMH
ncbi:MAG: tetratricopeptide repeat protein [Anaerolineaceae bacterium]|nr:tetratricopeptide repeat protein [Anaerolineaceae bacterium]